MVKVYSIEGVTPVVDPSAYVHPSACLIGDVIIGPECYIGPNACLRGDFGRIFIGKGANIQDCCIVHGFPERDTVVGENGHIGHGAVLHCCLIGRNALVGMNAVVMDKAEVGESSIVAAMALIRNCLLFFLDEDPHTSNINAFTESMAADSDKVMELVMRRF